jgi:hypothetical protein
MIERLAAVGQAVPEPEQISSDGLRNLQQAEIAKWWPILKAANLTAK